MLKLEDASARWILHLIQQDVQEKDIKFIKCSQATNAHHGDLYNHVHLNKYAVQVLAGALKLAGIKETKGA